ADIHQCRFGQRLGDEQDVVQAQSGPAQTGNDPALVASEGLLEVRTPQTEQLVGLDFAWSAHATLDGAPVLAISPRNAARHRMQRQTRTNLGRLIDWARLATAECSQLGAYGVDDRRRSMPERQAVGDKVPDTAPQTLVGWLRRYVRAGDRGPVADGNGR